MKRMKTEREERLLRIVLTLLDERQEYSQVRIPACVWMPLPRTVLVPFRSEKM